MMFMHPPYTFSKYERLCRKSIIDKLFEKGNRSLVRFPFRFIYVNAPIEGPFPIQALITVSRKSFPKSTQRNRIKRQLRELYRMHKHILYQALEGNQHRFALMLAYQGKTELDYQRHLQVFKQSIIQLSNELAKTNTTSVSASNQVL
jgi:ribonuclease P protein component